MCGQFCSSNHGSIVFTNVLDDHLGIPDVFHLLIHGPGDGVVALAIDLVAKAQKTSMICDGCNKTRTRLWMDIYICMYMNIERDRDIQYTWKNIEKQRTGGKRPKAICSKCIRNASPHSKTNRSKSGKSSRRHRSLLEPPKA